MDPDYGRLCEFGALSTMWLHSVQRDDVSKFAGLGTRCVFVGYPRGMRAYKFLDPMTNKIIRTDNARIHEGHYYWEDRTPMLSQEEMQVWNDVTSRSSGQQIETDDDNEWIEVRSRRGHGRRRAAGVELQPVLPEIVVTEAPEVSDDYPGPADETPERPDSPPAPRYPRRVRKEPERLISVIDPSRKTYQNIPQGDSIVDAPKPPTRSDVRVASSTGTPARPTKSVEEQIDELHRMAEKDVCGWR